MPVRGSHVVGAGEEDFGQGAAHVAAAEQGHPHRGRRMRVGQRVRVGRLMRGRRHRQTVQAARGMPAPCLVASRHWCELDLGEEPAPLSCMSHAATVLAGPGRAWQTSTMVALIGIALGVPLGIAAGRLVWNDFAANLGVGSDPIVQA